MQMAYMALGLVYLVIGLCLLLQSLHIWYIRRAYLGPVALMSLGLGVLTVRTTRQRSQGRRPSRLALPPAAE